MQVNIDFEDEQDMVEKMRIGLALQPIATALFSNSPFRGGKDTGQALQSHCFHQVYLASSADQLQTGIVVAKPVF